MFKTVTPEFSIILDKSKTIKLFIYFSRKCYSLNWKLSAVQRVIDLKAEGHQTAITEVAEALEISHSNLSKWCAQRARLSLECAAQPKTAKKGGKRGKQNAHIRKRFGGNRKPMFPEQEKTLYEEFKSRRHKGFGVGSKYFKTRMKQLVQSLPKGNSSRL